MGLKLGNLAETALEKCASTEDVLADLDDTIMKIAAFRDWVAEGHGIQAEQSNLRGDRWSKGGLRRSIQGAYHDDARTMTDRVFGDVPLFTTSTKRSKAVKEWLKKRRSEEANDPHMHTIKKDD